MKASITRSFKSYIFESIGILAIFLIWLFASLKIDNEIILPSINTVFKSLISLFKDSVTFKIIGFTLIRIMISLILGVLIGIILGVLSALFNPLYHILKPFIKIMRALPIASIILIILIMFGMKGYGDITFSPILVTLLMVIPIIYEAIYKGIKNLDKDLVDVARLETNSKFIVATRSYIPLIGNEMSISFSQSIGLSFKAMVMAEYVCQTQTSIGYSLLNAKSWLEYQDVFAWTIILIVLSVFLEALSMLILRKYQK